MPGHRPPGSERRVFVRVRPAADYDVQVAFSDDGLVWVPLQLLDLSLGGLGVLVGEDLAEKQPGDSLNLRVSLPDGGSCLAQGVIRHIAPGGVGVCGVEFSGLAQEDRSRIEHVVTELLERGNLA